MVADNRTPSPGDYIRKELDDRGWTQSDLSRILDRPLPTINRIIQGKHSVTPEMALALGEAFGQDPEVWMARESAYRLSLASLDRSEVRRRARLYELAPIKEMEKRQWIGTSDDAEKLEWELKRFFGVESLDKEPEIVASMRKSGDSQTPLTASQRAWCFRVRQLGSSVMAGEYREERLPECISTLRKIAAYPQETHKVPLALSKYGIRFAIVEPLAGSKVDGVALWADQRPIIGMSVRFDRIDNFWFTLCHELSHIRHRDAPHVDTDLSDQQQLLEVRSPVEARADIEAADTLIPKADMDSFVRRSRPPLLERANHSVCASNANSPGHHCGAASKAP